MRPQDAGDARLGYVKRKRRWLIVLFVIGTLIAVTVFIYTDRPRPRINRESWDEIRNRIEAGLTLAEVEAIIGTPPGDYSSWTLAPGLRRNVGLNRSDCFAQHLWIGDDSSIHVFVDESGKVQTTHLWEYAEPGDTVIDRLRLWAVWPPRLW
jgi:hypothetical protein